MIHLDLAYFLITLALVALAIVAHVQSTKLSLPIASWISFIVVLLPLGSAINAFYFPRLLNAAKKQSALRLERLQLPAFQTLQAVGTTILATLLSQYILPGPLLDCSLGTRWQKLFAGKDNGGIKAIQDALDCCGFRTVRDRAWPFPAPGTPATCAATFHRDTACMGPWTAAVQRFAGMDFGVVLAVGILQIVTAVVLSGSSNGWWTQGWKAQARESPRGQQRPLLEAEDTDEEEVPRRLRYDAVQNGQNEQGPRVEPSMLEQQAWGHNE